MTKRETIDTDTLDKADNALNTIVQTQSLIKSIITFYLSKNKKKAVTAEQLVELINTEVYGKKKTVTVYGMRIDSDLLPESWRERIAEWAWIFGWGNDQDTGETAPILWQRGYKAESTIPITDEMDTIQAMLESEFL